jgi:hypothetical protein
MSTLILPPKVETAVKPKPTKAEIISAMTKLKMQEIEEAAKARAIRRDELKKKCEAAVVAFVMANLSSIEPDVRLGYCNGSTPYGVSVSFDADPKKMPKTLISDLKEYELVSKPLARKIESDIRREISRAVQGIEAPDKRVESLLSSPESRKGLEKMLRLIGK